MCIVSTYTGFKVVFCCWYALLCQITHKLIIKLFRLHSSCEWFARVYTSINITFVHSKLIWNWQYIEGVVYKPRHDKTDKMSVRQAKTQINLGIRPVWSESSLSAWRKLGSLATHWAHSENWTEWVDAQADLSLRWAHNHFVGFVMSQLICFSVFYCKRV